MLARKTENPSSEASTIHEHRTSDTQAGFRKGRGTRNQTANIHWIIEKPRVSENIYFCLLTMQKLWLCGSQQTVDNSSRDGNTRPPTCLLRNLYTGQEATVRTGHRTTNWFQIEKGVCQDCILSPWLFNLYAEYIIRNAGLDEVQAGIQIGGRNINNLRSTDDATLMAESEEQLNSLLMKVKEELKSWLKTQHS